MKKLLFCISLAIPVALLVHSCKPDPSIPPNTDSPPFTPLPQDIKDYCVFKYGSYWVYQDSVSGEYDTVTVEEYSFDTINYKMDGKVIGTNETFRMKLLHSSDGFFDEIKLFAPPPPPPYNTPNTGFYISINRYKPGNVLGITIYQIYPYKLGEPIKDNNDTVTLVSRSNDEMHYHHGYHPGYGYSVVENYHRRNVGIFRKEVKNANAVWKLINYHVNQ